MSIKLSINKVAIQHTCIVFFIFLIITKIKCWPVFKQDPDFGILIWKHVDTQKISTQSSKLVVSRRSLYASPEVGDA